MIILAPIGVGELFDKITILEIKLEQYTDSVKVAHVTNELNQLKALTVAILIDLTEEVNELKEVNKLESMDPISLMTLRLWLLLQTHIE